jgi:hypothetical protein
MNENQKEPITLLGVVLRIAGFIIFLWLIKYIVGSLIYFATL